MQGDRLQSTVGMQVVQRALGCPCGMSTPTRESPRTSSPRYSGHPTFKVVGDTSIWTEFCSPKKSVEVPTPKTSECDFRWTESSQRKSVKMRSLGRALIQYAWWPYKKGKLEHRASTHRGKTKQRHMGRYSYKSSNAKDRWKIPEARRDKEGSSLGQSEGAWPC